MRRPVCPRAPLAQIPLQLLQCAAKPLQVLVVLMTLLAGSVFASHPSSEFVSLARANYNCSHNEYSYGTRCICTWVEICKSNQCRYESSPCGHKKTPFCIGKDVDARCISSSEVDSSNMKECTQNQMIEHHCLCNGVVCPASVFTKTPTLSLDVLNICSVQKICKRSDFGAFTVFPYNGEITGADPAL